MKSYSFLPILYKFINTKKFLNILMKFKKSFKKKLINCFLIFFFFLSITQNINNIYAQQNGNIIEISPIFFEMDEFTEDYGTNEDVSCLDINLHEDDWNLTDIHLNFTDIKLEREIKIIEDQPSGFEKYIYKKNPSLKTLALGVQMELFTSTKIYGIYIYGRRTLNATESIFFQINGYNEIENNPNNTIYRQINLNLGINEDWYYQNFSTPTPITLNKGNYSLVMNGSLIPTDASKYNRYYWMYNDPLNTVPLIPNLYISEFDNSWSPGIVNSTFLYKIEQKANKSCYPSDIGMSAEIDGQTYDISDRGTIGSGNLSISNINFKPNNTNLHIPINSYKYIIGLSSYFYLNFSCYYHIKFTKILNTIGQILFRKDLEENEINASLEINWTLTPEIRRFTNNHTVQFKYPNSWNSFQILKNQQDITNSSEILITANRNIFILNDTIENNSEWEIKAKSSNILFDFNIREEITRGDDLKYQVLNPIAGNYTFILFDADDIKIYNESKTYFGMDIVFSYNIPDTSVPGEYFAYLIWNNEIDAGIQVESIRVIEPFPLEEIIFWVIITAVVIIFSGLSVFTVRRAIQKRKIKHEEYKEKILLKCSDILNLNYILVSDIKSGLIVFEEVLPGQKIDSSLISGFLQAIDNFGIALTDTEESSKSLRLEFKNLKILISDSKSFRLIFILEENPSKYFLETVKDLMEDIMIYYGKSIEDFKGGSVKQFTGIKDLIEKHIQISFIHPLKVVKRDIKLSRNEKLMVHKALEIQELHDIDYFYVTYLIPENIWRSKDVEIILSLIDKGIFQSII
jgi:hypothetical protein